MNSIKTNFPRVCKICNYFLSGPFWKFKLSTYGLLLAIILSPPSRENVHFGDNDSYWPTVENQIAHPFTPILAHPKSHAANKSFRITVPLLARLFELDRRGIYLAQSAVILIMLWAILTLTFKITQSRQQSALLLTAMVPVYPVICSYQETTGHLDAFAYCFIILAMVPSNTWAIFILSTCAAWCDERAFVATSLVFVWWYFQETQTSQSSLKVSFQFPNKYCFAVITSWFGYIITRILLVKFTQLHIAMENPDLTILPQYIQHIPLLTFLTFGGLWLLPIYGSIYLLISEKYFLFALFLVPVVIITIISSLVWDYTRSISFLFPVIFIGLRIIQHFLSLKKIKLLLFSISSVSILLPSVYFDSQMNYIPGIIFEWLQFAIMKVYY
jgi:hypothetical protein